MRSLKFKSYTIIACFALLVIAIGTPVFFDRKNSTSLHTLTAPLTPTSGESVSITLMRAGAQTSEEPIVLTYLSANGREISTSEHMLSGQTALVLPLTLSRRSHGGAIQISTLNNTVAGKLTYTREDQSQEKISTRQTPLLHSKTLLRGTSYALTRTPSELPTPDKTLIIINPESSNLSVCIRERNARGSISLEKVVTVHPNQTLSEDILRSTTSVTVTPVLSPDGSLSGRNDASGSRISDSSGARSSDLGCDAPLDRDATYLATLSTTGESYADFAPFQAPHNIQAVLPIFAARETTNILNVFSTDSTQILITAHDVRGNQLPFDISSWCNVRPSNEDADMIRVRAFQAARCTLSEIDERVRFLKVASPFDFVSKLEVTSTSSDGTLNYASTVAQDIVLERANEPGFIVGGADSANITQELLLYRASAEQDNQDVTLYVNGEMATLPLQTSPLESEAVTLPLFAIAVPGLITTSSSLRTTLWSSSDKTLDISTGIKGSGEYLDTSIPASPSAPPTPTPTPTPTDPGLGNTVTVIELNEPLPLVANLSQINKEVRKIVINIPPEMNYGDEHKIDAIVLFKDNTVARLAPELLNFSTSQTDTFSYEPSTGMLRATDPSHDAQSTLGDDFLENAMAQLGDGGEACGTVSFAIDIPGITEIINEICITLGNNSESESISYKAEYEFSACCPAPYVACEYEDDDTCPSEKKTPGNCGQCVDCAAVSKGMDERTGECKPCSEFHERAFFYSGSFADLTKQPQVQEVGVLGGSCVVFCNDGQVWDSKIQDCVCENPSELYEDKEVHAPQQGTCDGFVSDSYYLEFDGEKFLIEGYCLGNPSEDFVPPITTTDWKYRECEDGRSAPCDGQCQNPCNSFLGDPMSDERPAPDMDRKYCACNGENCCEEEGGTWTGAFCECGCKDYNEVGTPTCSSGTLSEDSCACLKENACGYEYGDGSAAPTCAEGMLDYGTCSCRSPGEDKNRDDITEIAEGSKATYDNLSKGGTFDNGPGCQWKCKCEDEARAYWDKYLANYMMHLHQDLGFKYRGRSFFCDLRCTQEACSDYTKSSLYDSPYVRGATESYVDEVNQRFLDDIKRHEGEDTFYRDRCTGWVVDKRIYGEYCPYSWKVWKEFIPANESTIAAGTACNTHEHTDYDFRSGLKDCGMSDPQIDEWFEMLRFASIQDRWPLLYNGRTPHLQEEFRVEEEE